MTTQTILVTGATGNVGHHVATQLTEAGITSPANTLAWADQIRSAGVVRWAHGQAARSLIHERDIADVAARVLADGKHAGASYVLTGPEAVTQADQVRIIGEATGLPVRRDRK